MITAEANLISAKTDVSIANTRSITNNATLTPSKNPKSIVLSPFYPARAYSRKPCMLFVVVGTKLRQRLALYYISNHPNKANFSQQLYHQCVSM
jgi:hypothetical protein